MNSDELKLIKKGLEEAVECVKEGILDYSYEHEEADSSLSRIIIEERIKGLEEAKELIGYSIAEIDDSIKETEDKEMEELNSLKSDIKPTKKEVVKEQPQPKETLPEESKIEERKVIKELPEMSLGIKAFDEDEHLREEKTVKKPLSKEEKKKYRINPYMDVKSLQKAAKKTYRIK